MFEEFIDQSNGILLPSISNMTPACKFLKYNLGLRYTEGFILKPIHSAYPCMLGSPCIL
jgi:hypothetical protein